MQNKRTILNFAKPCSYDKKHLMVFNMINEANLGVLLSYIFGESEIEYQKNLSSNGRIVADYVIEKYKLIFEFDGPSHYTYAGTCLRDIKKDIFYKELGYEIIRIPFFVQPNRDFILSSVSKKTKARLKKECNFNYNYLFVDGFVCDFAVLPANFCFLGVERFVKDLQNMNISKMYKIFQTLKYRMESGDPLSVVPPILLDFNGIYELISLDYKVESFIKLFREINKNEKRKPIETQEEELVLKLINLNNELERLKEIESQVQDIEDEFYEDEDYDGKEEESNGEYNLPTEEYKPLISTQKDQIYINMSKEHFNFYQKLGGKKDKDSFGQCFAICMGIISNFFENDVISTLREYLNAYNNLDFYETELIISIIDHNYPIS